MTTSIRHGITLQPKGLGTHYGTLKPSGTLSGQIQITTTDGTEITTEITPDRDDIIGILGTFGILPSTLHEIRILNPDTGEWEYLEL